MSTNKHFQSAFDGDIDAMKIMIEFGTDLNIVDTTGSSLVNNAVLGGCLEVVTMLTIAGADLNMSDNNGSTPIHNASARGFSEAVKFLGTHGAICNTPDKDGWTPLNSSALRGHCEVVSSLLEFSADVNSRADGWTPLHSAVVGGHSEIVRMLAAAGAEVNEADNDGKVPLIDAARGGNLKMVTTLMECGADVDKIDEVGMTAINSAAFRSNLDIVKVLIQGGANLNLSDKNGVTPVNNASLRGHLAVVETLIMGGADVNFADSRDATPLRNAALKGRLEVMMALLEKSSADVNKVDKDGMTPLHYAAIHGHLDVVEALVTFGAQLMYPDTDGSTPLSCAAIEDHLAVVQTLLRLGADVNCADKEGLTPLNIAAIEGHVEVITTLVDSGANLNACDCKGWTPVNNAALRGHLEAVKVLLTHGADVNIAEDGCTTPLNSAALGGHSSLVQLLVDSGADVNKVDKDGWTPLNNAARGGHVDTVKALIAFNGDVNIPDHTDSTPLNNAANQGHLEVVKVLVAAGADLSTCRLEGGKSTFDKFRIVDINEILKLRGSPVVVAAESGLVQLLKPLMTLHHRMASSYPLGSPPTQLIGEGMDLLSLLPIALRQRNDALLKYLVELGVDITGSYQSEDGKQSLSYVDQVKDPALRRLLLQIERKREKFPVHSALRLGLKDESALLEIIRAHPSTVCDVDYMGCTAYQVAQQERTVSIAVVKEIVFAAAMLSVRQLEFPYTLKCTSGFESFRLNIPISQGKVYFEVTLAADDIFQIGFAAHNWHPKEPGYGVGDCRNSMAIDGSRQCFWYGGQVAPPHIMPKWAKGTVVGVGVCFNSIDTRTTIDFFFDSNLIEAPFRIKKNGIMANAIVAAVSIQGSENQACDLNFGERPLQHKPAGYSSIYEHCKKGFNRSMQIWDTSMVAWRQLRSDGGHIAHYWDDWAAVVSDEGGADLVQHVLSAKMDIAEDLLRVRDCDGRCPIDIASAPCRRVIDGLLHFMGRYAFASKTPEHSSKTCIVYLAKDLETDKLVAVKLMDNAEGLRQELDSRARLGLDGKHVIEVLQSFNGDDDHEFRREVQRRGFGEYKYCIVMPAAQRNLHQILSQENVAGRDWVRIRRMFEDILQCVDHLHRNQVIHGDLKPLNIMRLSTGELLLIDLDASRSFGCCNLAGRKFSSAFCPPEALCCDSLTGHIIPIFAMSQAAIDDVTADRAAVLSTEAFDMWALGAVLYQMCSGEPLLLSNYDNMLDSEGLTMLYNWEDGLKSQKLSKISDLYARNMISRLLVKDPVRRMSMSAALAHPFISGKTPTRMVGDAPKYDVFLSYRVASDSENAKRLYSHLTAAGLSVFWDHVCLQDGIPWEDGFCSGLVQSRAVVCLISRGAVSPRFSALTSTSYCDNVLLEHQLTLELRDMGLVEFIYPVFIGDMHYNGHFHPFDYNCYGNIQDVVVQSIVEKITSHLEKHALGAPLNAGRTVRQVVEGINANQGFIRIEGDPDEAFTEAAERIVSLCFNARATTEERQEEGKPHSGTSTMHDNELIQALERAGMAEAALAVIQEASSHLQERLVAAATANERLELDKQLLEAEVASLRAQLAQVQLTASK